MSGLLTMLNHLLATALAERTGGRAVQVRALTLEPDGGRMLLRVDHPLCRGELALRMHVEPPEGDRYVLRLTLEQAPAELGPALEPFRRAIEKARLQLELDFSP